MEGPIVHMGGAVVSDAAASLTRIERERADFISSPFSGAELAFSQSF